MKECRAGKENFRKWQQKQHHEITQLKMQEKKTVYEAQRLKQVAEKQVQVFRQKYEEAITCNNKLKRLLQRVDSNRSQKFNEQNLNKEIKYFLDQEFDVAASTEEARIHRENLISQRTDLTQQLKRAERRLERRERASQSSTATEDGATVETGELRAQIKNIKNEIELRNSEIAELQERIVAFDAKEEHRWASIRTLAHGKCALKLLFDMTVEERVTSMQDKAALAEVQSQNSDLMESNKQVTKEKKEVEKAMQQQVTMLEKRVDALQSTHQKQMAFLLTQLCASRDGKELDAGVIEKIMSIKDQLHEVEGEKNQVPEALNASDVNDRDYINTPKGHKRVHDDNASESITDDTVSSDGDQMPTSSTESATRRQEPDQATEPPKKALAYAPNNSASDDKEMPITYKGNVTMKRR